MKVVEHLVQTLGLIGVSGTPLPGEERQKAINDRFSMLI
jgi:hypothetical protein